MSSPCPRLRPLREEDERAALGAHADLVAADDFPFLLDYRPDEPWNSYLARLEAQRRGIALFNGWVPATFLVAVVGDRLVGAASIRHRLNRRLAVSGGHIGYSVLPAERRRGYATEILGQSLVIARALGVGNVLLTCSESNSGSRRVIELCGGVLESVVSHPSDGGPILRYWIE